LYDFCPDPDPALYEFAQIRNQDPALFEFCPDPDPDEYCTYFQQGIFSAKMVFSSLS
jgi:hypothetical protein